MLAAAKSKTPISDWLVEASFPLVAGIAFGTLGGLVARIMAPTILQRFARLRGQEATDDDIQVASFGEFIAVGSALGGLTLLLLWILEQRGVL